ncbi:putative transmembrane protein [Toxoplasma gondii p89]|uniref:Putative transmembrane protein n=1 Tax=Toxoplasma gondii p89 TaxID=943119 RepID=A0A086K991_TOXGO|nr:putative transmembrane protein [Toxoplasma gondii p89]
MMKQSFSRLAVRSVCTFLLCWTVLPVWTAFLTSPSPGPQQHLLLADALATPHLSISAFSIEPTQSLLLPRSSLAHFPPCEVPRASNPRLLCAIHLNVEQSEVHPRGSRVFFRDRRKEFLTHGGTLNQSLRALVHGQDKRNLHCSLSPGASTAVPSSTGLGRRGSLAFLWRQNTGKQEKLPDLLAFVGEECEYCRRMEPVEKAVEDLLPGTKIHRLEVWHNALNFQLLQELDRDGKCGGLPFYFNIRTLQWICGATTKTNLLAWASHQPCKSHEPPALQAEDLEVLNRRTGMFARLMRRVDKMRHEGEKAMQQTLQEQRRGREREQAEQRRLQGEADRSKRKD